MVICFYKEQVELLKSRNIGSIEIDMNYKAIDPYERCWAIHWAAWDYERNECKYSISLLWVLIVNSMM